MPPPSLKATLEGIKAALETISPNVPVDVAEAPDGADATVGYLIVEPMTDRLSGSLAGDWPHLDAAFHVKAVSDDWSKTANLLDHVRALFETGTVTVTGQTLIRVRFDNVSTSMQRDDDEGTVPLFWKADRYVAEVQ